jgi:cytochrome P450
VDVISKRLAVMGFAVIQSSAITMTNLVLDLAAYPLIQTHLATIRTEVLRELAIEHGVWSKAALSRMVTLDSCLRESMRMWGFVSRGVLKQVVAKNGITLPSGQRLPKGTNVGVHQYPVHHDEDIYTEHWKFDPMRFCTLGDDGKFQGPRLETTSTSFMGFSHGRHAW